jgi:[ribosomal protein S5]-alanine N-acetyltransferase
MIKGEKLILRRLQRDDLNKVLDWVNDPELFITMGIFGPRTENEQNDWYERISRSTTNIVFALCLKESNEHIGNVSLFDIDYKNRNCGLTIFIANKGYQGMGLWIRGNRIAK